MQIWSHLEKPCIRRLQCLLLVIHCHIHLGHFSRAYMLAGLAARAATALRLNYERPELSFVAQETRRRVLWTLSSIDGFFSVGLPEYETIPHTIIYQRLPSTEEAFWGGNAEGNLADHQPPLEALSSGGGSLLAACIRLSKISKDIMRLTRQLALSEQPLAQLGGFIQEIQNDLWRLRADIQLSFNYQVESSTRIFAMTGSRWFARFLQITVTWHQAHCDLYRLFLPEYQEAAPKIIMDSIEPSLKDNALQKCEEHVHHINEIIQGLLHLTSTPILPSYLAICCYQATRLSLFLAASPILRVQLDAATAVENANLALAVLERFFSNSPSVGKIVLDIQHLLQLSHTQPGSIYRELCCLSPPFDQGRHRHSHLAVHSLVRQANFVDDGYEDYDD
ncbi:hypothetical protein N7532_004513 [Penicillium argentinense]|uniref:Xylanolytic transcriptional activator regulatory domain-containing protein n=1 Tax=Penicillium argentinense TaxID=1131581 RepID=A0A9W9FPM2_9EURO|nr:uncharacterized protein N7532_004513 [Penicillium argentinense]KAJ5103984.1 hypothetical protein N7532_004513 [Penicillium argentinense]